MNPGDVELLYAYLDEGLGSSELRDLTTRLKTESALRHLLLDVAADEALLREWAISQSLPNTNQTGTGAAPSTLAEKTGLPALGQSWLIGTVLLSSLFFLLPLISIAMIAGNSGDVGLGLQAWSHSVKTQINHATGYTASLLGLFWLASQRLGWLRFPRVCGLGGGAAIIASMLFSQSHLEAITQQQQVGLERLIQDHRWVSYDSAYYWPADIEAETGRPGAEPNEDQINAELKLLRQAGFDGILIHECRDGQKSVAKIARQLGFKAVLQGIGPSNQNDSSTPATQHQIETAISISEWVDGYFLGERNARQVDFAELKGQLRRIRQATHKPATTSFLHEQFVGERGERLRSLEDFTIRSLSRPWDDDGLLHDNQKTKATPQGVANVVRNALETFRHDNKPSLLTTVFYPSGGPEHFSEETQYAFFEEVLSLPIPVGVNIVFFNSFDRPWINALGDSVPSFEPHTGLFAVEEIPQSTTLRFIPKKCVDLFKEKAKP